MTKPTHLHPLFVLLTPLLHVVPQNITTFAAKNTIKMLMNNKVMQQTIADYFKTQPVMKAWLFGSFARGEETPLSDVDILVLLDHSKPVGMKFFGMWNDLERLLDRKVDLVEEGELLPFATESANRDKRLIYERAY